MSLDKEKKIEEAEIVENFFKQEEELTEEYQQSTSDSLKWYVPW